MNTIDNIAFEEKNEKVEILEDKFIEDNKKHGRPIISLGMPEAGKSYLMLKFVLYCLINGIYDEYHIVAPQLESEENRSYDFLYKHKDKVFLYTKYHELISQKVNMLRAKKKIFFAVDDATAELLNNVDKEFIHLWMTTRHSQNGGLTMWIILHSAKKSIPPSIRQNVKYIFIYRVESDDLLEDTIYKEFLSLNYRKRGKKYINFLHEYTDAIDNNEYGCILVARKIGVDFSVNKWKLLNVEVPKEKQNKKIIEKPKTESFSLMRGLFFKR